MSRNQKSYSKMLVLFAVCCFGGWVGLTGVLKTPIADAQWRPVSEQKEFAAWGTIVENNSNEESTIPCAKNDRKDPWGDCGYHRVVFKTNAGVTFVIPFRRHDIEAIPRGLIAPINEDIPAVAATKEHKEHGTTVTTWCSGGCLCTGTCQSVEPTTYTVAATPAVPAHHHHVDGFKAHGILRYHLCDGSFYCFDSWEDK